MRLADQKLLVEFARLNLRIVRAQHPTLVEEVTEATITRSAGYKRLREFWLSLSPRKRERFAAGIRAQIAGVKQLLADAAKTGEKIDLADITIELFDRDTNKPIRAEDAPRIERE